MSGPESVLPTPENLANSLRAVGVREPNLLISLEDFDRAIDEYTAYSEEVRQELKRICKELSEDFEGLPVIGLFRLGAQFARICKFKPAQPQFMALLQLVYEINERPVITPGQAS